MDNYVEVEITIEFDERPTKDQVYQFLLDAIADDVLRYDIGNTMDAQND